MARFTLAIVAVAFACATPSSGQTTVGGVIEEDTTSSAGGTPYIVTDTLVVTPDSPKVFIGNSAIQSGGAVRVEGAMSNLWR
ncbi:MAG: hypothetical protein AAFV77_02410 [Planctomycetota bacterium]